MVLGSFNRDFDIGIVFSTYPSSRNDHKKFHVICTLIKWLDLRGYKHLSNIIHVRVYVITATIRFIYIDVKVHMT